MPILGGGNLDIKIMRILNTLPYRGNLLSEVYSHGLEHVMLCYEDDGSYSYLSPWITIQEGRYRYCVSPNGNIVKLVIAEYIAVEVRIGFTL